MLTNNIRVFYIINNDKKYINSYKTQYSDNMKSTNIKLKEKANLKVKCTNNNKTNNYSFDIKLIKKTMHIFEN